MFLCFSSSMNDVWLFRTTTRILGERAGGWVACYLKRGRFARVHSKGKLTIYKTFPSEGACFIECKSYSFAGFSSQAYSIRSMHLKVIAEWQEPP